VTDDELLDAFASNTLPAFPHEEHLHVVFVKSGRAGEAETLTFMRDGIIAMATAKGAPQNYHETRTVAWMKLVTAAREDFEGTFDEFLAANPQLVRRDLLSDYYSDVLLNSEEARAGWVEPDLRELPTAS
jgi:hypothetical protein